jgi:hypothetical protein
MIEINLLPEELRKKEEHINILAELPIQRGAIIFVCVFFVAQLFASIYAFYLSSNFKAMKAESDLLIAANAEIESQKSETLANKKRIEKADAVTHRKFYWSDFLSALSDSVTKGVWLKELSIDSDGKISRLSLTGSVVGKGEETAYTGKFIKELKNNSLFNELFDEIELSTINQKKIKEFDVYDFVILCPFKKGKI